MHEMILAMPNGYDTQIGLAGSVLSGGQRQRVGLARAMYGNPKLVVLDEPNASLDAEGELSLLRAMAYLKQTGVTTVVITHKINLLANVDKLLVMQNGLVAMFGPREAVLQQLMQNQQQAVQAQSQAAAPAQAVAAQSDKEVPHG
jgi:ABC-type protease/lipase transport system fused ATPase/permease subunit